MRFWKRCATCGAPIATCLTIGQYLRPTKNHHPLIRFYSPADFNEFRDAGLAMGFRHVASGPLVRSSYHADIQHEAAQNALVPVAGPG